MEDNVLDPLRKDLETVDDIIKPKEEKTDDLSDTSSTSNISNAFTDFTCNDGQGGYKKPSNEDFAKLERYLMKEYGDFVSGVQVIFPHLIIWCRWTPPGLKIPRHFAGLPAIILPVKLDHIDETIGQLPLYLFQRSDKGNMNVSIELAASVEDDLQNDNPSDATVIALNNHFSTSWALTYFQQNVWVELVELPHRQHQERLKGLPGRFGKSLMTELWYINGSDSPPGARRLTIEVVPNSDSPVVLYPVSAGLVHDPS